MAEPLNLHVVGAPSYQGQAVVGGALRLHAYVRDRANNLVTPGNVPTVTVLKPSQERGQGTTSDATEIDTGIFRHDLSLDEPGTWTVRWAVEPAADDYAGAEQLSFYVAPDLTAAPS